MTSSPETPAPTAAESWKMFDRIAFRYDLLNRILSFRQDVGWRKRMAKALPAGDSLRLLDLATGTGDVLLALYRYSGRIAKGVGLDMSANMLSHARTKVATKNLSSDLGLLRSDAAAIAAQDNSFDAATIAFGIRNVPNYQDALCEMHRILRPGGRVLVLEFSIPGNALFRVPYLFYFRHVLPRIGGLVSGDAAAYRYLNSSVESFPYGEEFCECLRAAGFNDVSGTPLTFGIATLYRGDK